MKYKVEQFISYFMSYILGKFIQNNPTYSRFSYNNLNYRLTMNNPIYYFI